VVKIFWSPCRAFAFLPHAPERTDAKPGEGQGETNCNRHPADARVPGPISHVFVSCANAAAGRHQQENKPGNLQPQLVQDASEGARRGRHGADQRAPEAAALSLLRRRTGHSAQVLKKRNLAHGLDFNSPWGYNVPNLCPLKTVLRGRASKWSSQVERDERAIGGHVDNQLKQLMKELGEAINESLSDSEQISEVVSRIKEGGYDIFLVLEATIGVSKQGEKSGDKTSLVTTLSTNPEFKVNDQDLKFLKSLRIKIEEDKEK
jgi:hypothetical protein